MTTQNNLNGWVRLEITFNIDDPDVEGKLIDPEPEIRKYEDVIMALPSIAYQLKQNGVKYKIKLRRIKGIFTYLATQVELKLAFAAFTRMGSQKYEEMYKK